MWGVLLRSLTIQRRLLFCILVLLCQHDFLCGGQSSGQGLSTHPPKGVHPRETWGSSLEVPPAPLDTPTPAGCDCVLLPISKPCPKQRPSDLNIPCPTYKLSWAAAGTGNYHSGSISKTSGRRAAHMEGSYQHG